jgi:hypothetical protein
MSKKLSEKSAGTAQKLAQSVAPQVHLPDAARSLLAA